MAKEFLVNCFTITTRTKSEFIKENSNFDKEVYGSFQDFVDDLYEFCADYDLRTDVESVNSNNTEFEIDFLRKNVSRPEVLTAPLALLLTRN